MSKKVAISHDSLLLSEIQLIIDHSRQYVAKWSIRNNSSLLGSWYAYSS